MRQHKQSNAKTLWGGVIIKPSPALALVAPRHLASALDNQSSCVAGSKTNYKNLLMGTLARGVAFSALALAIAPFILAAPVHATDNAVELTIGSDADLKHKQSSTDPYLHEATTPVKIKTAKPRGFNLTIHADSADLVNTKDNSRRIKGTIAFIDKESGREMLMGMNANSWGYRLEEGYGTKHMPDGFMHVPAGDEAPSVIVDTESEYDNAGCKGKKQCEVHMTFGTAILPNSLAAGKYSTTVTYTATAKPKPAPTVDPTICKSGDPKNDCQVDLDPNMIPVKYTGSTTNAQWTSLAKPEDSSNQGNWYNYNNKQWANAITVKDPSKYKNQTKVVDQSDILGYWVYIPRYAYEVMRRDGTDKPVDAQNFLISFEKTTTLKRRPAACSTTGKDYRTQCGLDRSYIKGQPSNQGTWATHPAFTFGKRELNGIWFAKFETTGTNTQPTVLPNERHIEGEHSGIQHIGGFYALAKTMGVNDLNNIGGNTSGVNVTQNNHHFATLSSHMVNNNDWGAATYLSASKYGAGYNGVQINASGANHDSSHGTTGCGPQSNGDTSEYDTSGTLGTQQACGNTDRAYNGTLGQLASTTNNPTGIYDMSGGGWEYVAASYSDNLNNSNTNSYFGSNAAHPPYANTYNFSDPNSCTFATCGGQALYEVNNGNSTGINNWNGNWMSFVESSSPWFARGDYYNDGSYAGLFYVGVDDGRADGGNAFRVALAPAPDPPKPHVGLESNECLSSNGGDRCVRNVGASTPLVFETDAVFALSYDEKSDFYLGLERHIVNQEVGGYVVGRRPYVKKKIWEGARKNSWYNYNRGMWAYLGLMKTGTDDDINHSRLWEELKNRHNKNKIEDKIKSVFIYVPDVDVVEGNKLHYRDTGYWVNANKFGCDFGDFNGYDHDTVMNKDLSSEQLSKIGKTVKLLSGVIGSPCNSIIDDSNKGGGGIGGGLIR